MFLILALLLWVNIVAGSMLQFEVGQVQRYELESELVLDSLFAHAPSGAHNADADGARYTVQVRGVVEVQCSDWDEEQSKALMAMNVFDLQATASGARHLVGLQHAAPMFADAGGHAMYFEQYSHGAIDSVFVHQDEQHGAHLDLKVNILNALQTALPSSAELNSASGRKKLSSKSMTETDVFGRHHTSVQYTRQSDKLASVGSLALKPILTVTKEFSDEDMIHAEESSSTINARSQVRTVQSVAADGALSHVEMRHIHNSSFANIESTMRLSRSRASLLALAPLHKWKTVRSQYVRARLGPDTDTDHQTPLQLSQPLRAGSIRRMHGTSSTHVQREVSTALQSLVDTPVRAPFSSHIVRTARRLVQLADQHPDAFLSAAEPHLANAHMSGDFAAPLFYVLTKTKHHRLQRLLASQGLHHPNVQVQQQALLAMHRVVGAPVGDELLASLATIAADDAHPLHRMALLTLGSALASARSEHMANDGAQMLQHMLDFKRDTDDYHYLETLLHATANAGPAIYETPDHAVEFLDHTESSVRQAALRAVRHYPANDVQQALQALRKRRANVDPNHNQPQSKNRIRVAAHDAVNADESTLSEFDGEISHSHNGNNKIVDVFPRNESIQAHWSIGNHVAKLLLQSSVFAGTNWFCNDPYFNYEVLTSMAAFAQVFDWHTEAVGAELSYGKVDGQALEDRATFTVNSKTVLHEDLSLADAYQCHENVRSLSNAVEPLYEQRWNVWSIPVPIDFVVQSDVVAALGFEYDVCDAQLEARVQLYPDTELVSSAAIEFEYPHFKVSLATVTQIGAGVGPSSYVELSECNAGVELDAIEDESDFNIEASFAVRECAWENHHWTNCKWQTASTTQLFHYDLPRASQAMEQKVWAVPMQQ